MVESDDPAEVEKLKSALTHGFYGKLSHAPYPAQQPAAGLVCASARPDQNPRHFRRPTWFVGGMARYQAGSSRRRMIQEIFRYDCLRRERTDQNLLAARTDCGGQGTELIQERA